MKRSAKAIATAVFLGLVALACGAENSVVDGRCRDGYVEVNAHCVASGSTIANGDGGSGNLVDELPDAAGDGSVGLGRASNPQNLPPAASCKDPFFVCHNACIRGSEDPRNCGACGKLCPSNICVGGVCQGATPGDVVAIGHTYANAFNGSAQLKVLVNAVTIATTDPIRVLAFDGDAAPATATNTRDLISAAVKGRAVSFTHAASAAELEATDLARSYDVVLLHAASSSDTGLGTRCATSFDKFTKSGGVIVALDDGTTPVPALLRDSGALAVVDHTPVGASKVFVSGPGDVVGVQVVSPYAPIGSSVGFTGVVPDVDVAVVVEDQEGTGLPVVVHRTIR